MEGHIFDAGMNTNSRETGFGCTTSRRIGNLFDKVESLNKKGTLKKICLESSLVPLDMDHAIEIPESDPGYYQQIERLRQLACSVFEKHYKNPGNIFGDDKYIEVIDSLKKIKKSLPEKLYRLYDSFYNAVINKATGIDLAVRTFGKNARKYLTRNTNN